VDPKVGTFTLKVKDKDVSLAAESKSAKSALEKVKVGDMVKVSYTEKDGKMTATSIVGVKGTEKKAEPAMEKSKAMEKPAAK
jgi:ribosomal 50S subunit-recycling heat shock protein